MKNKVYIDYYYGKVYWSIEELKNDLNAIKGIINHLPAQTKLKFILGEISLDEVINRIFLDQYTISYQLLETDSDTIYVNWNSDWAYSDLKEMLEDIYDNLDLTILQYALSLCDNNTEKLFYHISCKDINYEQVVKSFLDEEDGLTIEKKPTKRGK